MNDTSATINGLLNNVSILETRTNEQPYLPEDILYNDKEPVESIRELYYDEGFAVSDYTVFDFGEGITLMSTVTETISQVNTID